MAKKLPSRPHLDHLRRQAKSLLADLRSGDPQALATFREHLPAARELSDADLVRADFRLADAQSVAARETGFASWPQLARHVEQLRALEGTWGFERLEIDGSLIPAAGLSQSFLLIDGDRFRTESPEAVYEGIFNIDVEAEPHAIDIDFVEGPEAGNTNRGIYRLDGDRLEICLDMMGKPRPAAFETKPGKGHALETLRRVSKARPDDVRGGTPPAPADPLPTAQAGSFAFVDSPLMRRLQGKWSAVRAVSNGMELPPAMLKGGSRTLTGNELRIKFGGQTMIHALVRLDESTDPVQVDYQSLAGPAKGSVQLGIMTWIDGDACFCMSESGRPRPTTFESESGSGRTLSRWKPKA